MDTLPAFPVLDHMAVVAAPVYPTPCIPQVPTHDYFGCDHLINGPVEIWRKGEAVMASLFINSII